MMRQKMPNSLQPSSRAASINESGRSLMYWRMRKMPNASTASGRIRPPRVFTMPSCCTTRNVGTSTISSGSISVLRTNRKHSSRRGKRNLARP
ncbi:hypothetical protein D3C83_15350 [compost metagenome]